MFWTQLCEIKHKSHGTQNVTTYNSTIQNTKKMSATRKKQVVNSGARKG